MNRDEGAKIIRETFQNSFDRDKFTYFIKNLLNTIDESKAFHAHGYVKEKFKRQAGIIKTYERVGTYTDTEGRKIDILIVYLEKKNSIERARTMLRNFVADYLKQRDQKDAGLVAFVSSNPEDWRFSLVKMEYKFNEKGKVEEEFTPARRYSFLVGSNENSHTAQSCLLPLLLDDEVNPTLKELEDVFSVEKVTKEFFEKYRELFLKLKESLDEIVEKDKRVGEDFKIKNVNTVDFAKKLLGQIVFLYFLQKKGWFGVKRNEEWGSGSKHFLRELFEKKHGDYKSFFNEILEPLFYEALRLERSGDYYSPFDCRIPFLNGGLFDPINDYDWWNTDILLSNDIFSNDIKTKEGDIGTGILNIFDRYNFTVKEDEPLEKEVAVDPEMLGRVFENLLEVKDRKSKGTYYTPREIVHYMCQESLVNYLATELERKVSKEDIETLIKYGETVVEHEAEVESRGKETKTYSYKLPKSVRDNAKLIDDKLVAIRICDLAVGSGAFPVGMMNEVIRTRNALTPYIGKDGDRTAYNFKRHAIQNCLYGVDIDPSAVEIAKLRLWLSLIVDEEERETIQPLPNLDYKIVCGNSLLGVEKNLFNAGLFSELEKIKPLFFNETSSGKKKEYKKQIDEIIGKLTNGHKDFDFEIYFSEVFHEKKGFDVVIANPPYVSYGLRGVQKMPGQEKEYLKKAFPSSAEYKISLYAVFMDKAIQLSKPDGGLQTFIVPDSFLLGRYFSKIRQFILKTNEIIYILLLPYGVFDATVGFSVVYLFQRSKVIDEKHNVIAKFAETNDAVRNGEFLELAYPQTYFNNIRFNRFRLFFDEKVLQIISKIEKGSEELSSAIRFSSGLISKTGQKNIIYKEKKNEKWLPGIISGSEIKRYGVFPEGNFILYDKSKIKSGYDNVDYFSEKLFVRQTGDSLVCAVDNTRLLALNNVHIGNLLSKKFSVKYAASILNSRLLNFYYKSISLETGRVMAQTDIETIESLPIKAISHEEQKEFIDIVDKILNLTRGKNYLNNATNQTKVRDYEKQIDQLVYRLYGFTPEEIEIVETN